MHRNGPVIESSRVASQGGRSVFRLLGLIVVAGLGARLAGITFGLPALLDPDELMFELGAYRMLSGQTANPGWFGHPATTTIYVLALVDAAVFLFGYLVGTFRGAAEFGDMIFRDPSVLILPGRIAMILFAILGILLTYRLAARLFDRPTGLIAAALVASSPVHIAWSQVIRSDVMATTFMLATMLAALALLRGGRRRDLVIACLLCAVSIATKWPFALGFLAIVGALARRAADSKAGRAPALRLVLFACLLVPVFLVSVSPYLLLDLPTVLANLRGEAQQSHVGANGGSFLWNSGFYLSGPLLAALGPLGLALGLAGMTLRGTWREFWPVAGLPALAMFVLISLQNLVWERWAVSLIPILAIAASHLAVKAWRRFAPPLDKPAGLFLAAAICVLAFAPLGWSVHRNFVEKTNDNRRLATDWARANLPAGSTILVEHFAFDLFDAPFEILFPMGTAGCLDARDLLANKIDYALVDSLRGGNSNLDYAAVPRARRGTCQADFVIVTEYSRYAEEAAIHPEQYRSYRELLERSRIVCAFPLIARKTGGRDVLIVAPERASGALAEGPRSDTSAGMDPEACNV